MAPNPYKRLGVMGLMQEDGPLFHPSRSLDTSSGRPSLQPHDPTRTDGGTPEVTQPATIPRRTPPISELLRAFHRRALATTDRADMPSRMRELSTPPDSTDEGVFLDWLAERDALIDRALALGYVIGVLRGVAAGTMSWSGNGTGQIGGGSFSYPTGGQVSWHTAAPKNGDATLLNQGWAMRDSKDIEPRPHVPIPRWFLRDSKLG